MIQTAYDGHMDGDMLGYNVRRLRKGKGWTVRAVMQILGHSDSATTLEIYARVNPEQLERAAESMGRTLGG